MFNEKNFFTHKRIVWERLEPYGFTKTENGYLYSTKLSLESFQLQVLIDNNGNLQTELYDIASGSEYVLHKVNNSQGEFIGGIKAAYEKELTSIAQSCFQPDYFQTPTAQALLAYAAKTYQSQPEFLWTRLKDDDPEGPGGHKAAHLGRVCLAGILWDGQYNSLSGRLCERTDAGLFGRGSLLA